MIPAAAAFTTAARRAPLIRHGSTSRNTHLAIGSLTPDGSDRHTQLLGGDNEMITGIERIQARQGRSRNPEYELDGELSNLQAEGRILRK